MPGPTTLQASASVTLDANGNGTCYVGPGQSGNTGAGHWSVTGVILQTTRPNLSPIPSCQLYLDQVTPAQSQGLTANGSYATARGENLVVQRGQSLYAVWTGGQAGDVATLTVTGVKS